jgi:DNA-binding XRE family transcriptional regulator
MKLKTKKRAKTEARVMNWIEEQLDQDAALRQAVEELLNEMRIEQDLLALRLGRGVSQRQLAKTLGVSQPAIAKIESGKVKNLELRTLVRYATALGGSVKIEVRGRKNR